MGGWEPQKRGGMRMRVRMRMQGERAAHTHKPVHTHTQRLPPSHSCLSPLPDPSSSPRNCCGPNAVLSVHPHTSTPHIAPHSPSLTRPLPPNPSLGPAGSKVRERGRVLPPCCGRLATGHHRLLHGCIWGEGGTGEPSVVSQSRPSTQPRSHPIHPAPPERNNAERTQSTSMVRGSAVEAACCATIRSICPRVTGPISSRCFAHCGFYWGLSEVGGGERRR